MAKNRDCSNCAWNVLYGEDEFCIEQFVDVEVERQDVVIEGDLYCRMWSPCNKDNLCIRKEIINEKREDWNERIYRDLN